MSDPPEVKKLERIPEGKWSSPAKSFISPA